MHKEQVYIHPEQDIVCNKEEIKCNIIKQYKKVYVQLCYQRRHKKNIINTGQKFLTIHIKY